MATPARDDDQHREPLSGLVERVTFHNVETGFCVLRVNVLRVKMCGHRDLLTVLGSAAEVHAGESIQASGRWGQHCDHGQQFRVSFLQVVPPSSIEGIKRSRLGHRARVVNPDAADEPRHGQSDGV